MAKGIVRSLDELGRLVVPIGIRRQLEWLPGDNLEITVSGSVVSVKKYEPGCLLCGETENLEKVYGKNLCLSCRTSAARTVSR